MAIFKSSPFGNVKKSLGGVVSYGLNGQGVLRNKPASYNDRKSDSQVAQRTQMTSVVHVYKHIADIVKQNFLNMKETRSSYNEFVSKNVVSGVIPATGDNDDVDLIYDEFVAGAGVIPAPPSVITRPTNGTINVEFNIPADSQYLTTESNCTVLCYDTRGPAKTIVKFKAGTDLNNDETFTLPSGFETGTVVVWVCYQDASYTNSSEQVYSGELATV